MGPIIFIVVLTVIALLAFTPKAERGLALGLMMAVTGFVWFAVKIKLHSVLAEILGSALDFVWGYRIILLEILASLIVLIVPLLMIYVAVCDRLEASAVSRAIEAVEAREAPDTMGLTPNTIQLSIICEGGSHALAARRKRRGELSR